LLTVQATLWSDYLCPWCYLGRDRSSLMESLGVTITRLPFELHPDVPLTGRAVRPGGRLHAVLERIGAECAEVGMAFRMPTTIPNTRRALEAAEVVRTSWPRAFASLDESLFEAVFVRGDDIGDREQLDHLIERAGAPRDEVVHALEAGAGADGLQAAMELARSHGITATPTWLLESGLMIPGAQPREVLTRWIERIRQRSDDH
jgi:predicted DsbA family dithiol-disulfide isomerase